MPGGFLLDARRCPEEDLTFYGQFTSGQFTSGHPPGTLWASPDILRASFEHPQGISSGHFLPESFFT